MAFAIVKRSLLAMNSIAISGFVGLAPGTQAQPVQAPVASASA